MTTVPLADARARLSQLVESAATTHERVEITRNGVRTAILMSTDDYDSLMETIGILSDAELVREIMQSVAEAASGDTVTTDELLAELSHSGRASRTSLG